MSAKDILKEKREETLEAIRKTPMAVRAKALEHDDTLTRHVNTVIPTDDDGVTGMEWIQNEMGIRLEDDDEGYSTRLVDLGDMTDEGFERSPEGVVFGEAVQQRFHDTVRGPAPPRVDPDKIERDALVSAMTPGSPLRPYATEAFIRAELFAPEVDYRRIVGRVRTIAESDIEIPKFENASGERVMGSTPEGTPPKLMQLGFGEVKAEFNGVGTGIRASYDFLRNNRSRAESITNAVDEIAIQYRQFLFLEVVKAIHAKKPSTDTSIGSGGTPAWEQWEEKIVDGLIPYRADIVICRVSEKHKWLTMVAGGTGTNGNTSSMLQLILTGALQDANAPLNLNERPLVAGIGATSQLNSTLAANFFLVFDKLRSSAVYFQRNASQDETQRDPENRWVTRYLNTKWQVVVPDENGIKGATYA